MMADLNLRKSIELAIATEQLGADYYSRMVRKFEKEKGLKEIFEKLVKDEKAHEAQFKALLKTIPEEEGKPEHYELYQFLRATAISEFFRQDAFKNADAIKTPADALGRSLAFEKSTLLYYEAIRDILGASPQLDEIIQAEKTHVTALFKVISSDAKFRSLTDNWE
jgi:rubrerythrin